MRLAGSNGGNGRIRMGPLFVLIQAMEAAGLE